MDYSKQFAASATGFADRYRNDTFFRTEAHIVGLQALLLILLLAAIGFSVGLLSHRVPGMLWGSDSETRLILLVAATFVMVTIAGSIAITRLALMPVRYALESQKLFIGNVAHELRTPLSIVKTDTEVALMSKTLDASVRNTFLSIVEELDRASEILNNHLSLSLATAPNKMRFHRVDLAAVVAATMSRLARLADARNIEVELQTGGECMVWGNEDALEHILTNVLRNALTHTPPEGRILITVESLASGYVECAIQDSGHGISRKDLARIFEPYYRADPSRVRAGSQSGLGLTIVSELVKQHGGKVSVRSSLGNGTTVTILIPEVEGGARDAATHETLHDTSPMRGGNQRTLFDGMRTEYSEHVLTLLN